MLQDPTISKTLKQHARRLPYSLLKATPRSSNICGCAASIYSTLETRQPSIAFAAEYQQHLEPFLLRLSSTLNEVKICYNSSDECNVYHSLSSLHSTLPILSSLILKYTGGTWDSIPQIMVDTALLRWNVTLQRLLLTSMTCKHILHRDDLHNGVSALGFLNGMSALKDLELCYVSPHLTTTDIAGCTGLVKLILWGNCSILRPRNFANRILDLTTCASLQTVTSRDYGLDGLIVNGLAVLQHIDCRRNCIQKLGVSFRSCSPGFDLPR